MRPEHLSVRPPVGAGRKRRKVSLVFHHLQAEELAIHITYLEHKCFRRLTVSHRYNFVKLLYLNIGPCYIMKLYRYFVQCPMPVLNHFFSSRNTMVTKCTISVEKE